MTAILVTATEESAGKTAVGVAVGLLARDRGLSVGYMKPKGTRLESAVGKTLDRDPLLAREVLDLDDEVETMEPVVYSETFVDGALRGREDPATLRTRVREAYATVAADRDLVVVEGGADLATGAIVDLTDADVADLLDATVVAVAPYRDRGDADAVLATAEHFGDRLAGVVLNAVPESEVDAVTEDVVPFLEGRGVAVLGVVPRDPALSGVTVATLADELGAEVVTDVPTDALVRRFLVGAMSGEGALSYFRRTSEAAVVTGGDRADLQTVALEAPGVACLVLTGGFRVPDAVVGKAEQRGVPVLSVRTDTLTTLERGEALLRGGRTRDADTVRRMADLLADHADVDGILGAAGVGEGDGEEAARESGGGSAGDGDE